MTKCLSSDIIFSDMKDDYTKEALENTVKSFKTSTYDQEFFKATLDLLQADLDDLDKWSAYNQDKYNAEIDIIRKALELIKENK